MANTLSAVWNAILNWPYLVPIASLCLGLSVLSSLVEQQKAGRTFVGLTFYRERNPFRFWLHQIVFGCMSAFLVVKGISDLLKLVQIK
jgi:hypothetical protein